MSWQTRVVEALAASKRAGVDFDTAWSLAMMRFPPRARDVGVERPTLFGVDAEDLSVVEFFRRGCEDAWHGRRPALRYLSAESLDDDLMLPRAA